jgi:hypothetical protein
LLRGLGFSVPSEFLVGTLLVATSPFDSKTTKRPLALISLAEDVNWKNEPLAEEEVSWTMNGSGVALAACAKTE